MEDFALRLTNIVSQLATLGDPKKPTKALEKFLRIARGRYKQVVVSMETLLDISTLSIEEVTRRVRASEDNTEPKQNLDFENCTSLRNSGSRDTSPTARATGIRIMSGIVHQRASLVVVQALKHASIARHRRATLTGVGTETSLAIGPGSAGTRSKMSKPKLMLPRNTRTHSFSKVVSRCLLGHLSITVWHHSKRLR